MKETGPEAVPPPARGSREERIPERLEPVPDPNLNSIPSVLASPRIDSMVSFTELMKQAEARSEEHTSELQSRVDLVCRLLLEKKKKNKNITHTVDIMT